MEAGMRAHRSSLGGNHSPQGGGLCWHQPASKGAAMLAAGARQGFPCASGIPADLQRSLPGAWRPGLSTQLDTSSFLGA